MAVFFVGVLCHFHVSSTWFALLQSCGQEPGRGRFGFFYDTLFYLETGNGLNIKISLKDFCPISDQTWTISNNHRSECNKVWKRGLYLLGCHRRFRSYGIICCRYNFLGLLTSNLFCARLSGSSDKFPSKQPKVIAIHSHKSLLAVEQSLEGTRLLFSREQKRDGTVRLL